MHAESRKRSHSVEDEPTIQKKRVLTGANGSPHVNGVVTDADEPKDGDNLELFRKEAIFRRMKHYSRENGRSQAQIAELEQRKNTCEAGMVAIAACWEQLVAAIRTLVRPEDLTPANATAKSLFDLTEHVSTNRAPALKSALEDNMQNTQQLITQFIQLGEQKGPSILHDEAYRQCQKAQNENIALKSEMTLVRSKLRDSESKNTKYHADLVAAETRADRLRSGTVQAMQARLPATKSDTKAEEVEESKIAEAPPSPRQPEANGNTQLVSEELDTLQEIARSRELKIVEVEHENAILRDELNLLKIELKIPPFETIADSASYKTLLDHTSRLEHMISEHGDQLPRLRDELAQLRSTRKEWEDSVIAAAEVAKEELRTMISRKDSDNLRLRDQREQQTSEMNERKHKESVKMASLNELKTLAGSRLDRIAALESEVKRYKAQLAANTGNEDLLAFFLGNNPEDISYIDDLKKRLAAAECRADSLAQSLSRFDDDHPEIRQYVSAEAEVRQQLADTTKLLEKYQSVYGDSPDIQQLSDQLQRKEQEVEKLKLLNTERGEAVTSLYAEIDKLSAAWEALDRQVKDKIFDLTAMEERLAKLGHERGKAENKFYAAMRDKEAVEAERKNISRNFDKQAKLLERLLESEKSLTQQVATLEKEVVLWQKGTEEMKKKVELVEMQCGEWRYRAEYERGRLMELRGLIQNHEATMDAKAAELRRVEEEVLRLRKEAERQASKYKLLTTGTSSQKEAELQSEIDKCMSVLKCSTCQMQMRNTVITKCMHTFCRQCVDARITTRQRKCPACNLGFASSDVQQVFFQ